MINLFEFFDQKTLELYLTLKRAGREHKTFVMEDDGFLPDDIITPYRYLSGYHSETAPCFFNEVKIPKFWEITGDNNQGLINDLGKIRGRIIYRKNFGARVVEQVDWLTENGRVQYSHHYTKNGFVYARTTYHDGIPVLKHYFDQKNKIIMYENYITNDICILHHGKEILFQDKLSLISFLLEKLQIDVKTIIFNSLGTPFFTIHQMPNVKDAFLFWQETSSDYIPGNMEYLLNNPSETNYKIVIPDYSEYESIISKTSSEFHSLIFPGGYIYHYHKTNQFSKNVLTVTNSDQVLGLEQLASSLPEYTFHVVAITEMSTKLLELSRYTNIKLYPRATMKKIREIYSFADIYLDINRGNEIVNAVRSAFDYDLLIMSFDETTHNNTVILPDLRYKVTEVNKMIEQIKASKSCKKDLLAKQKQFANAITREEFNQLLS